MKRPWRASRNVRRSVRCLEPLSKSLRQGVASMPWRTSGARQCGRSGRGREEGLAALVEAAER